MEEMVKLLSMVSAVLMVALLAAGRLAGSMWGSAGLSRCTAGTGNRGSSSPPGSRADHS